MSNEVERFKHVQSLSSSIFYCLSMRIREKISSHRLHQMHMRSQCWIAGACMVCMYTICMELGWSTKHSWLGIWVQSRQFRCKECKLQPGKLFLILHPILYWQMFFFFSKLYFPGREMSLLWLLEHCAADLTYVKDCTAWELDKVYYKRLFSPHLQFFLEEVFCVWVFFSVGMTLFDAIP